MCRRTIPLACTLLALFCFLPAPVRHACASKIHKPVAAGTFYPKNAKDLTALIDRLSKNAPSRGFEVPAQAHVKALLMPHAGYVYSGSTAAYAGCVLLKNEFSRVIIMAPDHYVGFSGGAISDAAAYATPLGRVALDPDAARLRDLFPIFTSSPDSDAREHSIEVILPFLQHFLGRFKMIPIVMGPGNIDQYADAIDTIIDQNTLLVVSTDLSHYLPYRTAMARDRQTIEMILNCSIDRLSASENRACGIIPLQVLLRIAKRHGWKPVLLHYANNGDKSGPKQQVVGYATIAFFGEPQMKNNSESSGQLNREKGEVLIELARKTIAEQIGLEIDLPADFTAKLEDNVFQEQRGTFVTLTIDKRLRGCIGNLAPDRTILEGVRDNAINAAFHDPRFSPLKASEFQKIRIEVSLLSVPQPLQFTDGDDLLAKIRPDIDGLIIRKGIYSATFLPQVWEQLPDKRSFLEHLCMKAGLPASEWQKPGLKVFTYQVQYFEEGH